MSSRIALHFIKHRADSAHINGLQHHNERKPGGKHSNEHIRDKDTHKNVFLFADDRTLKKRIDERLNLGYNGRYRIRKDAIRMVEATVQISGDILNQPETVQEVFFMKSFNWLKHRYGEDNVVSAVIHKDETTMHLHFDFVPLTDAGRLSARTIIGPIGLKRVQADFLKYMQEQYPELGFARGDGKNNGLSQKAYEALATETAHQKQIIDDYKKKAQEDIDNQRKALDAKFKSLEADIEARTEAIKAKEFVLAERESRINDTIKKIQRLAD